MRAAVFAAVCVVTTALGHALMADDVLPWWAVGVAFAGTASGAWRLTRRERRSVTVVGATVVAQGLLHLLFSLTHQLVRQPHEVGFSHSGAVMHHPGMHAKAMETPYDAPFLPTVMHGLSAGMLLAHLLAAAACGVWLWWGETAAHRIGRALAAALLAPLRRVCRVLLHGAVRCEAPSCRLVDSAAEDARPTPSSLRHAVVRRGPPLGRSSVHRLSPGPLPAVRL
ncbi:hypothetical protein STVIR_2568 [Streptomyces viridochromogenes Tue57]|uniref:Integral membrane protein n=1 Tax=Streptomyces viridochromogenes Tue57 TaxID=1160705 RepID=L8PJ40_STRVR|nr:hypothetical protein STVIR_2568 [Streptomyces viridochromogenes Tue57]